MLLGMILCSVILTKQFTFNSHLASLVNFSFIACLQAKIKVFIFIGHFFFEIVGMATKSDFRASEIRVVENISKAASG